MTQAKLYKSLSWLYQRRITERKTIPEIAKEAGVSESTIRRALEAKGLK